MACRKKGTETSEIEFSTNVIQTPNYREGNMAVISISRGSYSKGKEVAEKVAAQLGYRCLSREVILDASENYHIPEIKLAKAIHDAPSILERFGRDKTRFITYYQSALVRDVQKGNVVYHGLAGHLLLKGIPHVLKVRIIADLDERVCHEMECERIPKQEALRLILKDDQQRRKWTQSLYGVDPWDCSLYDLVLSIQKLTIADAVDFICRAAQLPQFRTTEESQRKIDDLALASQVKAALVGDYPGISVKSDYGNILIYTKADARLLRKLEAKAKSLCRDIEGIKSLEVQFGAEVPAQRYLEG
jgi:cytidylate kinase